MNPIDITKAEKWPNPRHGGHKAPSHIDLPCPHEGCGKPTFGIKLNWQFHSTSAVTEIQCAGCERPITYCMVNVPKGCDDPQERGTAIYQVIAEQK